MNNLTTLEYIVSEYKVDCGVLFPLVMTGESFSSMIYFLFGGTRCWTNGKAHVCHSASFANGNCLSKGVELPIVKLEEFS